MSDYLWDKTGEPEEEIQQLERMFEPLRYERPAQPLPMPVMSKQPARRHLSPYLAAAAALIMMLMAGGLWLALHRHGKEGKGQVVAATSTPVPDRGPQTGPDKSMAGGQENLNGEPDNYGIVKAGTVSHQANRRTSPRVRFESSQEFYTRKFAGNLVRQQRGQQLEREGEMAKAKLIMALQITSDKLNLAQKKIQTNQNRVPIS